MKQNLIALILAGACAPCLVAPAEEGGSGHYMPGATASFIDVLPGYEAFAYANLFTYYDGSAQAGRTLEFGGNVTLNASATVYADTSVLFYETPWKFLGGEYAAGVAIPYVWMTVTGDVQRNGPLGGV